MSTKSNLSNRSWLIAMLTLLLLAASCGSDSDSDGAETDSQLDTETASTSDEPASEEPADEPVEEEQAGGDAPSRIVSLSATATETLFAIGAGDQVIAVDSTSNYPPEAPITDLSAFEPSLEAIAALDPDLVILSFDPGELQSGLEGVGIATLLQGTALDLDDAYGQIAELGIATGNEDGATDVVATLRSQIDEIVAAAPSDGEPVRIYHEIDDTYFSASSPSFIGQLYALLNTVNIADEADADGFGFPQLNPEYILEADPQLIVITDQVNYTPEDVAARPGWDGIAAVQSDSVIVVDADIASRWGPRLPQFLESVAAALDAVPVPAG